MTRSTLYLWAALVIGCAPWLALIFDMRVTADAAWLTQAAGQFLHGRAMTDYYFDTNPPMSFLIYLPARFLELAGLKLWDALNVYLLALTVFSVASSWFVLSRWPAQTILKLVILWAFTLVLTLGSTYTYAQKDQMIALALLPFTLIQVSQTYKYDVPKGAALLILLICAPYLMLKPHYLIIPIAGFIHRFIVQRNFFDAFFGADALVLLACGLGYIALTQLFFPDFFITALPATLALYVGQMTWVNVLPYAGAFAFLATCAGVMASLSDRASKDDKRLALTLCALAMGCAGVYALQNKGFGYHSIPFIAFGLGAFLSAGLMQFRLPENIPYLKIIPVVCILFWGVNGLLNTTTLPFRHNFLKDNEVAQMIAETPEGASFYIEHNSTDYVAQISAYQNRPIASRFPHIWFMGLVNLPDEDRATYTELFGNDLAEDITRDKPALMFFVADEGVHSVLSIFGDHPAFKAALSHYRKRETLTSKDFIYHFAGDMTDYPVTFAVYERMKN